MKMVDRWSLRRTAHLASALVLASVALTPAEASCSIPDGRIQSSADTATRDTNATRETTVSFVKGVTTPGGEDFVEPELRIATFDNDGSLWAEHPSPFQLFFALDLLQQKAMRCRRGHA